MPRPVLALLKASTLVRRPDRSARDLDPAIRPLRRAAHELRAARTTIR